MSRLVPRTFKGFTGGEAAYVNKHSDAPKYSIKLQNCHIAKNGSIIVLPGYSALNPAYPVSGTALTSGYDYRKKGAAPIRLSAGGGNIYRLVDGEPVVIKSGLDADAKIHFNMFNDLCIMCNGVDAAMKYDGTTVSALANAPATTFMTHTHRGRLWFGTRDNPLLPTHSALHAAETQEGYIDFQYILGSGDELVDMCTFVDLHVFVFRNHVVIYSGQTPSTVNSDYAIVQKIEGVGAVATGMCCNLGTDLLVLAADGLKTLKQVVANGSLSQGNVSDAITPTIQSAVNNNTSGIWGVAHYKKMGWLMVLIGEVVMCFDYTRKAWHRLTGVDANYIYSTIDGQVIICGNEYMYEYGEGLSYGGNDIYWVWESGFLPFTAQGYTAYPKWVDLYVSGPNVRANVQVRFNNGFSASSPREIIIKPKASLMDEELDTTIDQSFYLDSTYPSPVRVPTFGNGESMQLIVYGKSNSGPVEIEISAVKVFAELGGI